MAALRALLLVAVFGSACQDTTGSHVSSADASSRPTSTTTSTGTLRVMSFNIRNSQARDGQNKWSLRKPLVIDRVLSFDPDIVGLQEVLPDQRAYLIAQLSEYDVVARGRGVRDDEGEAVPIFFRRSRFSANRSGHFWLSETPEVPGSKSWDSSLERMVTWVELRDAAGTTFTVFNTHFDHRGVQAQLHSAGLLYNRATAVQGPVVMTGDFNALPGSAPHVALVKSPFIDSYREAVPVVSRTEATVNGFGNAGVPTMPVGARIDWVLHTSPFVARSAAIDRSRPGGRFPSDHFPVTVVLARK